MAYSPNNLPDEAKLASIMIQSILYGIYFVLFTRTMTILFARNIMKTDMHRIMLVTAIIMGIIATGHLTVSGVRVVRIFAQERISGDVPNPSLSRFSNITNLVNVGLNLVQVLLGDSFLLYRMAVVWGRDWRYYTFPLILLAASIGTAVGVIYELGGAPIWGSAVDTRWVVSFIAMTLSTNIVCTSLIAVKIWKINRLSAHFVGHSLTPVMLVVIESGAIYSCTLIALLVCYVTSNWAQFLILDWVSAIVGCVFSMVIARLGMGLCRPDGTTLDMLESAMPSISWQSRRRHSDEVLKLTMEEVTTVRGDPKPDGTVSSCQGRTLSPTVAISPITEPRSAWRG